VWVGRGIGLRSLAVGEAEKRRAGGERFSVRRREGRERERTERDSPKERYSPFGGGEGGRSQRSSGGRSSIDGWGSWEPWMLGVSAEEGACSSV